MIDVPAVVRNKAVAAGAAHWLDDLPALVADLERDWSISVGRPYGGGTEAFVAEAMRHDGTPDVGRGAMLLERLGRSLHELALPIEQRLEILCSAATRMWRPAPGQGLPTGAEKGAWLIDFIATTWEEVGRPCSERAIDHALACAARRIAAHDDERAVLVHGDVHQWNVCQAEDGFKLVDPDGLLAEAEYDMGVLMREDPLELLGGDAHVRARWLARRTGLDATAIWEWGVVERVSTGLLCTTVDLQPGV